MIDFEETPGPLAGLVVVDMSTMMAGPWAATYLGDLGARVIKLEVPSSGDHARRFGPTKDGESLLWVSIARNKECITLDIRTDEGAGLFRKLIGKVDVLIENFRPGTLERRNIGWTTLSAINPGLVMLRVTGFGQDGPYSSFRGFGTVAEAMSGFAHLTGMPDGPPTLPAFPLADGVCSVFGALSIMSAIYERDVGGSGLGQYIDISLFEPLMRFMESQTIQYDQLGSVGERTGNRLSDAAPRNTYLTGDGDWVALSASAQPVAERVFRVMGVPELVDDPRFATQDARVANVEELDQILEDWFAARSTEEAVDAMRKAGCAVGPVYRMDDVYEDPHYQYRGVFTSLEHPVLGTVRVPNVHARLSRTPGSVRHLGRPLGADNQRVYTELLGLTSEEVDELQASGVI